MLSSKTEGLYLKINGDFDQALQILNDSLKAVPQSDKVRRQIAFLYHDQLKFELAGDFFKSAAPLSSQIEQQMEDLEHAEENYNMASSSSAAVRDKLDQIGHLKVHFKEIARNEYTAFRT